MAVNTQRDRMIQQGEKLPSLSSPESNVSTRERQVWVTMASDHADAVGVDEFPDVHLIR
ncbi:hypothetical protein [Saccharomonospora azurea]|nr:hypothetical protein [Saccharomonospora azurea]